MPVEEIWPHGKDEKGMLVIVGPGRGWLARKLRHWLGVDDCETVTRRVAQRLEAETKGRETETQAIREKAEGSEKQLSSLGEFISQMVVCIHCGALTHRAKAIPIKYEDKEGKEKGAFLCQRDQHRASGVIHPARTMPKVMFP